MMKSVVRCEINGEEREVLADGRDTLLDLLARPRRPHRHQGRLRQRQLRHVHRAVRWRARQRLPCAGREASGARITTIEGIANGNVLDAVQQALVAHGGSQCGFCTPGIVISAVALLKRNATPTDDEIRHAIAGNLCRCTGYDKIVEAIRSIADPSQAAAP